MQFGRRIIGPSARDLNIPGPGATETPILILGKLKGVFTPLADAILVMPRPFPRKRGRALGKGRSGGKTGDQQRGSASQPQRQRTQPGEALHCMTSNT